MDYAKINEAALNYKDDMTRFLRAIVKIPEKAVMKRPMWIPSPLK